jgi:two-component system chemotaxis response regulator CheB
MITRRSQQAQPLDRLRREGQQPDATGLDTERFLENLIVIGASAGGQKACKEVLRNLPEAIPAAVIVMQHMASESPPDFLPSWLGEATRLPIIAIRSGERIRGGAVYIVPPGKSVSLKGRRLELASILPRTGPDATINILFQSAAQAFGDRVIGVILTGLLRDGTNGLKAVHDAGGLTIVQDPTEAEYPDMPASAMKDLPVTFCLRLADIGPTLELLVRRSTQLETGLTVSIRMLKERLSLLVSLMAQSKNNLATYQFLSTELIALEGDLSSIQGLLDTVLAQVHSQQKGRKGSTR